MLTIETTAVIAADHTLTVRVPEGMPPGPCKVTVTVEPPRSRLPFGLIPVDTGPWPDGFTASREQLYDDDGR